MSRKKQDKPTRTYAPTLKNRRARHDYHILETFEAGVELKGNEVKSIRNSEVSLEEAFARMRDNEVFLFGCHIKPYEHGDPDRLPNPTRPRKLLLHRREIRTLIGKVAQKGVTLIPLKMYFKRGRVKVELGVCRGKQDYDKREKLKRQESRREIDRAMSRRR
jgi:SsrA-binding protein